MLSQGWRDRAKCAGTDPLTWETERIPVQGERARDLVAKAKCSGCPVMRECGLEVVNETLDHGVIRMGVALDHHSSGRKIREQHNNMRVMLGIPIIPEPERDIPTEEDLRLEWPKPCRDCGKMMRPREHASLEDWPDTTRAYTRTQCQKCYVTSLRERNANSGKGIGTIRPSARNSAAS